MPEMKLYAMVRITEGREWYDRDSLSFDREECQARSDRVDKDMRTWARANPQLRIERVQVVPTEIC